MVLCRVTLLLKGGYESKNELKNYRTICSREYSWQILFSMYTEELAVRLRRMNEGMRVGRD